MYPISKGKCIGCGDLLVKYQVAISKYGHGDMCTICAMAESFYGDFVGDYLQLCEDYQFPFQFIGISNK
jgi:hypothetical protein